MRIQITLTVPEAKRLIAMGIAHRADILEALKSARILLKGGTTGSAIAEEIVGEKLRIGGRITVNGTKNALKKQDQAHCILIENGSFVNVDENIEDVTSSLGSDDIIIASANAFDSEGYAAMLAAAPLGHYPGRAMAGFSSQGCKVIIAVGLEKMIPGTIRDAILASGRESVYRAFGSAVGLIPLVGEIYTEREAISTLANVKATVIASGGILGAEGATTMVVEGSDDEVNRIFHLILDIKGEATSGTPESLEECVQGCLQCKRHLACIYKLGLFSEKKEHPLEKTKLDNNSSKNYKLEVSKGDR